MIIFNQQIKKIIGIFSISTVLAGIIFCISVKQKNNVENVKEENQVSNEQIGGNNLNTKTDIQQENYKICRTLLDENENDIALRAYTEKDIVDCVFSGCGGMY